MGDAAFTEVEIVGSLDGRMVARIADADESLVLC